MLEVLGGQSDYFHAGFGVGAILAGVLLLRLPTNLRFMQGEGMVQLVRIAGWIAVVGGLVIALSGLALVLG
jgi:hypothetical protein